MELKDIENFKNKYNADLFFDFDIKKFNWFNIGGKSKIFFKPKNLIELKEFLKLYKNRGKIFILGMGSNVLFNDKIYEGVIIKLSNNFSTLSKLKPDTIIAGSASSQKKLSEYAQSNGIGGFEFMYCIPGSVGGGIQMNSGCFGTEFKDKLISLQCIDTNGNIKIIPSNKIKFKYREIELNENLIFLSATFKGNLANKDEIKNLMEEMALKKNNSQPSKIKTGGSTFKNPIDQTTIKAWQLIKESVPENINFGDACISKKHSNFFVNKNKASFNEMNSLIRFVKKKVKDKTGININLEIKIVE
ncbi:UDP-N-acetylmuramate dehydrogenase [Candidatus Pelagibacter sp.]|nr:UDP-N-acetylmuramate dehydrogenase [Candidatus Pelagibacter sp.]